MLNLYRLIEIRLFLRRLKVFILPLRFLFILFIFISNLYPQENEIYFNHLTTEDGLSLNAVTKIMQDSQGYLWFGTYQGLDRYDGYIFKNFLPNPSNPYSMSNFSIWSLFEDSKGSIWIGTLNGLNRYDKKTERFYVYKNNPKDPNSICENYIRSIYEDKSGTVWIGTQNGLSKFNREKNNFTSTKLVYNRLNPYSLNSVLCIEEDYKGNIWLGTWDGLTCIQKDGRKIFISLPDQNNLNTLPFNTIIAIKQDNKRNLWIGTNGYGLYKYDLQSGIFTNYSNKINNLNSISDNYVSVIYQDRLNNLWIGTKNGLNRFNLQTGHFTRIYHDPNRSSSICNNEILSITEDKAGMLWIGTMGGGISKFSLSENKFNYVKDNNITKNILKDGQIISVFANKQNEILLSTKKGFIELAKDESKAGELHPVNYLYHEPGNINSISDNYVRCAIKDHLGLIWIGTDVAGLNCYNPQTKINKVYRYAEDDHSLSNNGIVSLCEDHNGNIWIGTWWGLNLFDRKTEKFTRYFDLTKNNSIWMIYEDSRHYIWCGTDGSGVKRYDPKTKSFIYFVHDTIKAKISVSNRVFSACESSDSIMWFGTSEGLGKFDYRTNRYTSYTKDDGLPSNVINDIKEDEFGNLWISSPKGLTKFTRKTGKFKTYTKRNGLKEVDFAPNSSAKLTNGTLIFGCNSGAMYFNPKTLNKEHFDAPIVFTDFKIYNQSIPISNNGILKESIQSSKKIIIPPGNNVITLEFALLDFFDPKNNTFRYKLEGFDAQWNDVGTRNSATYTNLPPGHYNFFVRASNYNEVENEKGSSLEIIIVPAYYQTWWFKIVLIFVAFFTIAFIYQARTRVIKRTNKMLETKVNERTMDLDKTIKELNQEIATKDKFFSIIAHDLRSPFTGLIGLLKYLVEDVDSITKEELKNISETMLKSAEITFELLENLLQWARIKTGRINYEPEILNLKRTLDEVIELYRDTALNKKISINRIANDDIYVFADENMLKTVLRNLISNSIKFTNREGEINISVADESSFIRIKVCDSGVGMSQEKLDRIFEVDKNTSSLGTENEKGSGLGLILCKEFIELNKGTITVNSKLGKGSEFSFTLCKNQFN